MRQSLLLRILSVALLAALAPLAGATTVYKFRDADGVTHYTDRNPGGRQDAEVLDLWGSSSSSATAQQHIVVVEKRGTPQRPELYLVNKNPAPAEVEFHLSEQGNVRPQSIPARWIVAGNSETRVATLLPQNPALPLRYDYQVRSQLGDPRAKPDERYAYSPPVPAQAAFLISQGFNGDYSHHTDSSRYAIDIGMPVGTGIRAARGGEVVKVQDGHSGGGSSSELRGQTNNIYVLHDDGTFGIYAHLRRGSALVQPGQRVRAGQLIAQSGNTGYSTGPHLHFAVLRNAGMKWESVPFLLASPYGVVKPVRGMAITGLPMALVASRAQ